MKLLIISFLVISSFSVCAQSASIPGWFVKSYKKHQLNERYELKQYIKPAFIQADFNGDGVVDIAALIIERRTKKKGILVIQGKTFEYVIFGAGNNVGKISIDGSDDLKWMGVWKVFNHKTAYETTFNDGDITGSIKRKLPNKGISIWSLEDGEPLAGGIIYWDKKNWAWIHQGE